MGRSTGAALAACLAALAAAPAPARGQARAPAPEEWGRVTPLFALVEAVAAGAPAPSDVALRWQCDFIAADAGVVFVPFTLAIERNAFTSFPLAMYVRVVRRGAPAPAPGPKDPLAHYPFEDASIIRRLNAPRISRAFTAPPGDYDVYVAIAEAAAADSTRPRTVVLRQAVTVPDLGTDFTTSSIIVADRVEADAASRRATFDGQLDEPYRLWGSRITPALRRSFGRAETLSIVFLVYNARAADNDKPDVEVDYALHRRDGAGEAPFARLSPERFSAATLPASFSLAAGDLIVAGREMPLGTFPAGNYRLEIRVTDRARGRTLARNVFFAVAGGHDR